VSEPHTVGRAHRLLVGVPIWWTTVRGRQRRQCAAANVASAGLPTSPACGRQHLQRGSVEEERRDATTHDRAFDTLPDTRTQGSLTSTQRGQALAGHSSRSTARSKMVGSVTCRRVVLTTHVQLRSAWCGHRAYPEPASRPCYHSCKQSADRIAGDSLRSDVVESDRGQCHFKICSNQLQG